MVESWSELYGCQSCLIKMNGYTRVTPRSSVPIWPLS